MTPLRRALEITPVRRDEPGAVALRLALVALISMAAAAYAPRSNPAPVAGWLERARLSPGGILLEAKLDTGAYTSSLHAAKLLQFKRDGKDWVAFDVAGKDGRKIRIERPLVRISRITSALGTDGGRPTVTLGICVGSVYRLTEVNLVDRSDLDVPLLIGRLFLSGRLLIDPSRRYLLEPACGRTKAP